MKIELKELCCSSWDDKQEITLDANTVETVEALIGEVDSDFSEIFSVDVCNSDYVKNKIREDGYFYETWHLVIDVPSHENIRNYFTRKISKLTGNTWHDFREKLRFIAMSEYENYVECQ